MADNTIPADPSSQALPTFPPPDPNLDPNAWNVGPLNAATGVMLSLAVIAIGLRFWSRSYLLRVTALEDWLILASLVFSIGITCMLGPMYTHSFGRHMVFVSPEDMVMNLKYSFVVSILYICSLTCTKLSILFLYIRVLVYPYVRLAAKVLLGIVIVTHVYILATMLTACVPLNAFWDLSVRMGLTTAYCHGMPIYWSHAGLNIVTDFLIFILPLTVLHRIRSPKPQKIALAVTFLLAFAVCSISLARSILLAKSMDEGGMDVTWDSASTAVWNALEVNIAIVCGCLVTLKPVGAKLFPKIFTPDPSVSLPGTAEIDSARGPRVAARYGSEDIDLMDTKDEERDLGRETSAEEGATKEVVTVAEKAG